MLMQELIYHIFMLTSSLSAFINHAKWAQKTTHTADE